MYVHTYMQLVKIYVHFMLQTLRQNQASSGGVSTASEYVVVI